MSAKIPQDQKAAQREAKIELHDHKVEHFFRHILHFLERVVASITLVVLIIALAYEVFTLIVNPAHLTDINAFLHHILTIVVGLEFVRMLIDLTPSNTTEVLIVALARQVILSHDNPLSNIASVLCIAGLFAVRRFLIPKEQMQKELSEVE